MAGLRAFLSKAPLLVRVLGLYLVVAGIAGGVLVATPRPQRVYAEENPSVLIEVAEEVAQESPDIFGTPVAMTVERLGVSLRVLSGEFDTVTNTWSLTDTGAHYAAVSSLPGTRPGTTVIYGHNRAAVFAPLADLQVDDVVQLTLSDGTTLDYRYARDAQVTPDAVDVLYEASDVPQLVLLTCDGAWDQFRRVMYLTLDEVRS